MQRCLLIFLIALLEACASAPRQSASAYRPLPAEARSALHGVEVLIGANPLEIDTGRVDETTARKRESSGNYGGGVRVGNGNPEGDLIVLAAIMIIVAAGYVIERGGETGVDAYRRFMANRAMTPITRSIGDADFSARLREALVRADGPELLAGNGQVTLISPATPENFEAQHALAQKDASLIVRLSYTMNHDLNTLTLKADASLIPRSDEMWRLQYKLFRDGQRMDKLPGKLMTDPQHALYRRVMRFSQSLPAHIDDRDKAAEAWAANDAAALRGVFDTGLAAVAKLVAADLAGKPSTGVLDVDGKRLIVFSAGDDSTLLRQP